MDLGTYLRQFGSLALVWGESDCCTFAADWCVLNGHGDPMARWRGKYSTEVEALAYIHGAGGLIELWALGMSDAGMIETASPIEGDIGLIDSALPGAPVIGGIFTGRRWAMRGDRGLFVASATPLRAWRV